MFGGQRRKRLTRKPPRSADLIKADMDKNMKKIDEALDERNEEKFLFFAQHRQELKKELEGNSNA